MSEYRLFAQRIGLIGLISLFSGLSAMLFLPILTKNMPLADFGIWSQVNVTMGLVSTFMIISLPDALTRFAAAAKSKEELQERFYTIFFMVLGWGTVVALLILYFSGTLADLLFGGNVAIARIVPLLVLVHSLNILLSYYFRTVRQMKRYSLFSLMTILLDIILVSGFVLTGHGIYGAVLALFISRAISFAVMLLFLILSIGFKVPQFKDARDYLAFGLPLVPTTLSYWVLNSSNRYVITILLGTASVGLFSPGYILGNILTMFIGPLMLVLPVDLSRYHDNDRRDMVESMLGRTMKYYLALAIPSVFGLSLLSKPILSVLSTKEIASQGYLITPFIAVSMLLYGITSILSNIIILQKKTVYLCMIWVGVGLLNLSLNIALVHYIGIMGAAIATLVSFISLLLLIAYSAHRYMKFKLDYVFLSKSVLASLAMSTVTLIWDPTRLWEIFIMIGICIIVYFASLFLLRGIDREEIVFFKETISKRP